VNNGQAELTHIAECILLILQLTQLSTLAHKEKLYCLFFLLLSSLFLGSNSTKQTLVSSVQLVAQVRTCHSPMHLYSISNEKIEQLFRDGHHNVQRAWNDTLKREV
jgi:hypothetical protein